MGEKQGSDYQVFGMQMPGRNGNTGDYRYGYQGSEKDDEVKGEGNSYTTHFRQLDPRVGRWLSIDPKASSMPWQSPYISMDNNPIMYSDKYGDSIENEFGTEQSDRAIEMFNKTGIGKDYLKKFAAAGQTMYIGGEEVTFEEDGEYHKQGIDLVLSDRMTGVGQGTTSSEIKDGRLKINVNLTTRIGEDRRNLSFGDQLIEAEKKFSENSWQYKKAYNKFIAGRSGTLTHEFFVHTESSINDFKHNGKLDKSHQGGMNDHDYFMKAWKGNDVKYFRSGASIKPQIININHTNLFMYEGYYIKKAVHGYLRTGVEDADILNDMYQSLRPQTHE